MRLTRCVITLGTVVGAFALATNAAAVRAPVAQFHASAVHSLATTTPSDGGLIEFTPSVRERVTELARQAKASHPADPSAAQRAYVIAFNSEFGDVNPASSVLIRGGAIQVELVTPLRDFHQQVNDRLRMLEPLEGLKPLRGVGVLIVPLRIDSPDYVKVLLRRDEELVEPLESNLVARQFTTAAGLSFTKHSGSIVFPSDAFRPDAKVTLILIPSDSGNRNVELTADALRELK